MTCQVPKNLHLIFHKIKLVLVCFALHLGYSILYSELIFSNLHFSAFAYVVNTPVQLRDNVSWILFHQCDFVQIVNSQRPFYSSPMSTLKVTVQISFFWYHYQKIFSFLSNLSLYFSHFFPLIYSFNNIEDLLELVGEYSWESLGLQGDKTSPH